MSWYLQAITNYANFSGRARRTEYWMFTLFNTLFISITYIPGRILATSHETVGTALIFLIICLLYELVVLIPSIAVVVRRLHDQDKSGGWYFISLVPFIGGIWLLILMCTEGTYGPNQYGEDPKQQWTRPSLNRAPAVAASAQPEPRPTFRITSVTLSKMQADKDEEMEAKITYQNNGNEIKDYLLTLYVNDAEVHRQYIDIPPYTQGSVDIQIPPIPEIGVYTVRVGNCSQKLMIGQVNFMVEKSTPEHTEPNSTAVSAPQQPEPESAFRITSVKLSKLQAVKGEEVEARITYQNNGDEIKDYPMTLTVSGVEVHKRHIDIPPYSQGSVDFKVPPISEDGVYTVRAGNCFQKLMIRQPEFIPDRSAPAHTEPKSTAVSAPVHAKPNFTAVSAPQYTRPKYADVSSPARTDPKSTFRITSLMLSKMQADKGEEIEARITYQNNGGEIKDYLMILYVNDAEVHRQHFDIPSYTQGMVAMPIPPLTEDGVYTVWVGNCSQNLMIGNVDLAHAASAFSQTRSKPAAVSSPARSDPKSTFRITSVKLSKMQADRGEEIEARITYQNNGNEIKDYLMILYVNDAEVHRQHFDIPSFTQGSVTMQVPPLSESGLYTVRADNCSQKLFIV